METECHVACSHCNSWLLQPYDPHDENYFFIYSSRHIQILIHSWNFARFGFIYTMYTSEIFSASWIIVFYIADIFSPSFYSWYSCWDFSSCQHSLFLNSWIVLKLVFRLLGFSKQSTTANYCLILWKNQGNWDQHIFWSTFERWNYWSDEKKWGKINLILFLIKINLFEKSGSKQYEFVKQVWIVLYDFPFMDFVCR